MNIHRRLEAINEEREDWKLVNDYLGALAVFSAPLIFIAIGLVAHALGWL